MTITIELIEKAQAALLAYLAACAPATESEMQAELVRQCPGIDLSNVATVQVIALARLLVDGRVEEYPSEFDTAWELAQPGQYDGQTIPQSTTPISQHDRLRLLETHPIFTGRCPHCGANIASTDPSWSESCTRCQIAINALWRSVEEPSVDEFSVPIHREPDYEAEPPSFEPS